MATPRIGGIGGSVDGAENWLDAGLLRRHGHSVANAGGLTMEHAAIPLSPLGLAQAAALPTVFDVKPSLVLASSYLRGQLPPIA